MTATEIVEGIAAKYGITVESLEAGRFPPKEMEVLIELSNKALNGLKDSDIRAYFEQKAKFITKRY
jgi:hypothetical protein